MSPELELLVALDARHTRWAERVGGYPPQSVIVAGPSLVIAPTDDEKTAVAVTPLRSALDLFAKAKELAQTGACDSLDEALSEVGL